MTVLIVVFLLGLFAGFLLACNWIRRADESVLDSIRRVLRGGGSGEE